MKHTPFFLIVPIILYSTPFCKRKNIFFEAQIHPGRYSSAPLMYAPFSTVEWGEGPRDCVYVMLGAMNAGFPEKSSRYIQYINIIHKYIEGSLGV